MRIRSLKLTVLVLLTGVSLLINERSLAVERSVVEDTRPLPPGPSSPFSPSNAQTEDRGLIPVEQFFPASRCVSCHQDTHRAWSESLHRNAAREPFYRESADILLRTRGIEFTRHCESCHTPVALFSGALTKESTKQQAPFTELDHEGVTCSVCHSITEARLDGTGSFTIRRPALLAREDGTPIYGAFTDEQILADVPGHKRAVMRPLLRQPEFCAVCHKVDAPPALNDYKHIRGFSAYDEWQQSGASLESVLPFYRREQRADCRTCHMPKVESTNDRAAKQGKIASHRWLGANTIAPLFYGQKDQAKLTESFLQANVVDVEIFAIRRGLTGRLIAPLSSDKTNQLALNPGEEIITEVVVSNRNAAHSFPPEVRDLYEAWVEFEAIDGAGKTIFHSGFLKPDGILDESAHVYKAILLDEQGRHITRHQIWLTNIKAYDNTILPGRSDVVCFKFSLPKEEKAPVPITLRARVNYRRINQEYANYVLRRQSRELPLPIVKMAEISVRLAIGESQTNARTPEGKEVTSDWKRWNDYGIGLLEQAQFGQAADAFRRASELRPLDLNLLVNTAIAELRTERFGPELEQLHKAALLLEAALKADQTHERARFYRALVWRAQGKVPEAAGELRLLASIYPRDREVQRAYAQTVYSLGRNAEARIGFEAIVSIDPTDFLAWQFLAPIYATEGRTKDSERAHSLYFQWRDDPRAEAVAARFFAAHPQWADERVGLHIHNQNSSLRPVLSGQYAAPEQ